MLPLDHFWADFLASEILQQLIVIDCMSRVVEKQRHNYSGCRTTSKGRAEEMSVGCSAQQATEEWENVSTTKGWVVPIPWTSYGLTLNSSFFSCDCSWLSGCCSCFSICICGLQGITDKLVPAVVCGAVCGAVRAFAGKGACPPGGNAAGRVQTGGFGVRIGRCMPHAIASGWTL